MICRICALGLVATGLFATGCTINHYEVVHKDQYLVIIGGSDKESQTDEDSDGQVTTLPVGKKAAPAPQRPADSDRSL